MANIKPTDSIPESGTVTVACKIPNGLLLRVFRPVDVEYEVLGGGKKTATEYVQEGDPVHVKGPAVPFGVIPTYRIVGGYALTENIDAQFFRRWMEENKKTPMVINQQIFAYASTERAASASKERTDERSGLEPITPDSDVRIPRAQVVKPGGEFEKISTGNKQAA